MILDNSNIKPVAEEKWEDKLNISEQIDWQIIWSFNLQAVKENKISEFNFKLLHNLIPHRYNLYKWKLCNNPICLFDEDLHDSFHLFVDCQHTKSFWSRFSDC